MAAEDAGFAGLNLAELLDRLHDIVLPEPVALLPQTPGWWVLLAWLVASMLVHWQRRRSARARDAYRRAALAELERIASSGDDPETLAASIAVLLKRTALAAYPRAEVGALTGPAWAEFLERSAGGDAVVVDGAAALSRAAFAPDVDGAQLVAPARRWIEVHGG